jgi:hypothetical protein
LPTLKEKDSILTIYPLQSTKLSFKVSDLFKPISDSRMVHNNLSLIDIGSDSQSPLLTSSSQSLASSLSQLLSPSRPALSVHSVPELLPNLDPLAIVKMTTVPLPSCNKCSAPKWDSQYEAQLATFFEEYKIVVHDASITADQEKMKKKVLH